MKLLYILLICSLLLSCKQEKNELYDLDFTIKYDAFLKSFKIDNKGDAVVLINEKGEEPKVYKTSFSKSEVDFINESLQKIDFTKCDSIESDYVDGTRYMLILKNVETKKEIVVLNDYCEERKPLNDLVYYISRTFDKKKKEDFYKSIDGLVFVKPNLSNTISKE